MSLQMSNTTGRRTPQVYQGFGAAVVAGAGVLTTPTAANGGGGGGATNANSGSVGRPPKGAAGGNKQSQIPVAIGAGGVVATTPTTGHNEPTAVPQTAVVHPAAGTGGSSDGQKQHQNQPVDQVYGGAVTMKRSTLTLQQQVPVRAQATNGSQPAGGAAGNVAAVEKNGTSQKKNAAAANGGGGGEGGPAGKKSETVQQTAAATTAEVGAKVRDSPRSRGQQKSDEVVVATSVPGVETSLLAEKPLKGFDADGGEEMESLLLETIDLDEVPTTPVRTPAAKSKSQKNTPQAQVSPFKAGGKAEQSPKAAGKQQAVAEDAAKNRSPKAATTDAGVVAAAPATPTDTGLIGRPLRSISGRRSTRPISDIKFTHHRRSAEQNESFSSLNVTIGSEVGNELLRTPQSASRKRKDMTPESTSDLAGPSGGAVDSPKRARLDFSGFLNMVATPVTMLRSRLSRVNLQSTPRSLAVEEEDASKVVTAEATTTTTTNVTPQKDGEEAATGEAATLMEVDEKKEKAEGAAAATEKDAAGAAGEQLLESSSTVVDDEVEVKIVSEGQQEPQKQWCSIM